MSRAHKLFLLVGLSFAGCSTNNNAGFQNGKAMDGSDVSTKSVSGSDVAVCHAEVDLDGNPLEVYGWDGDGDGLAMIPSNWSDIYASVDGYLQYLCMVGADGGVPVGYVLVETDPEIGEDCDYTDPEIGAATTAYVDNDGDGLGTGDGIAQCGVEPGYSTVAGDCDDTNVDIGTAPSWYLDADSDGSGDPAEPAVAACGQPEGYVDNDGDCNDDVWAINPDAVEICDELDNDCDTAVDDDDDSIAAWSQQPYYVDADSDGYGIGEAMYACTPPEGSACEPGDCDDTVETGFYVNPDATEVCDTVDNDCDGSTNEDDVCVDPDPDSDGDGVVDSLDCDDGNVNVYPGATEVWDDGIDQDCDGSDSVTPADNDGDNDGFDNEAAGGTDCDDTNDAVYPGATEVPFDGIDNGCTGFPSPTASATFCVTPEPALMSFAFEFWARDSTVDPDGTSSSGWAHPGISSGTGERCGTVTVIDGNVESFNGLFDIDGDGVYGEQCTDPDCDATNDGVRDQDGVWLFMDTTHSAGITVNGYPIVISSWPYTTGWDGQWTVDTQ